MQQIVMRLLLLLMVVAQLDVVTSNRYYYYRPRQTVVRRPQQVLDCDRVQLVPGALTVDGDFVTSRDATPGYPRMTALQCRTLCMHQQIAPNYCMGINYRVDDGVCLMAGYHLRPSNHSVHFRRICAEGRRCFKQVDGWESRFHTGFIAVPPDLASMTWAGATAAAAEPVAESDHPPRDPLAADDHRRRALQLSTADFCRTECERSPTCYGFDVRVLDGAVVDWICPYVEFRQTHSTAFELHVRTCWS